MLDFLNDKHAHMHATMLALMHTVWRLINNYEISNYFFWCVQGNKLIHNIKIMYTYACNT